MLRMILLALSITLLIFAVVVARQPSHFRITRSEVISAPPDVIFEQVNDLRLWEAWSPWAKLDPNAKNSFSGPAFGEGAVMSWAGNKDVGEGNMTITESRPDHYIKMRLEFIKPFAAVNTTEFAFKPEGEKTAVVWSMSGKNNFIAKAVGLIMNCEKMVGGDFEKGLAQLKAVSEAKVNG